MKFLKGRTAIITGGANGIGAALCKSLVKEKMQVYSLDKFPPEKYTPGIKYIHADVTNMHSVAAALSGIEQIDLLVNNAGVIRRGALRDLTEQDYDLLFDVNVKGYWIMLKQASPLLAKGATVLMMASRHGINLPADPGVYAVTKQANIGLAEVYAKAYPGIDVKVACPGSIDTALGRHQVSEETLSEKKKRMKTPEFLAAQLVKLIKSNKKKLVFDERKKKYSFK